VEGKGRKEGEGGRPTTNLWPIGHAWPSLNSYFHLPPIMLTPLTKIIKSKANSFYPFSKFFLFIIFNFLDFILCNDEINMLWKIKMVDENGREMQMVEEGRKMKYEITTGLFSR
jgi:hypothetical protein